MAATHALLPYGVLSLPPRMEAALLPYRGALVLVTHDDRLGHALCTTTFTLAHLRARFAREALKHPSIVSLSRARGWPAAADGR